MGVGSILTGIALALVVGAYLARPFRTMEVDLDRAIEIWVAQVHAAGETEGIDEGGMNYCRQCGRRLGRDDRFCPECGTRLQGDAE
jgi:hypothetical protein